MRVAPQEVAPGAAVDPVGDAVEREHDIGARPRIELVPARPAAEAIRAGPTTQGVVAIAGYTLGEIAAELVTAGPAVQQSSRRSPVRSSSPAPPSRVSSPSPLCSVSSPAPPDSTQPTAAGEFITDAGHGVSAPAEPDRLEAGHRITFRRPAGRQIESHSRVVLEADLVSEAGAAVEHVRVGSGAVIVGERVLARRARQDIAPATTGEQIIAGAAAGSLSTSLVPATDTVIALASPDPASTERRSWS